MTQGRENIGKYEPDFLVYDTKIPIDTKTIQAQSGQGTLKRGTVIAVTASDFTGAAWTGDGGQIADSILCDDVDTGDTGGSSVLAHAYRSGHFARQALIYGAAVTEISETGEKELRDAGIYLSNAVL
jgi:hypothetical protein